MNRFALAALIRAVESSSDVMASESIQLSDWKICIPPLTKVHSKHRGDKPEAQSHRSYWHRTYPVSPLTGKILVLSAEELTTRKVWNVLHPDFLFCSEAAVKSVTSARQQCSCRLWGPNFSCFIKPNNFLFSLKNFVSNCFLLKKTSVWRDCAPCFIYCCR